MSDRDQTMGEQPDTGPEGDPLAPWRPDGEQQLWQLHLDQAAGDKAKALASLTDAAQALDIEASPREARLHWATVLRRELADRSDREDQVVSGTCQRL